jgi:sugar phosphate isomerase/epimerase
VFGDPLPSGGRGARARSYEAQAKYLACGAEKAAASGVRLVLETHSNFRAFDTGEVLFRAGYPKGLWVNWHLGHCLRHGEDVDEAYRHVKGRVGHCHFSLTEDAVSSDAIRRQLELLGDDGFDEFFSVEVIDPDDGEAVLAHHAAAWRELTAELGL